MRAFANKKGLTERRRPHLCEFGVSVKSVKTTYFYLLAKKVTHVMTFQTLDSSHESHLHLVYSHRLDNTTRKCFKSLDKFMLNLQLNVLYSMRGGDARLTP